MNSNYMAYDDPQAHIDMVQKPMPEKHPKSRLNDPVLCPKCQGYGGWHLKLNDFGPGIHLNAACNQCNGWGWVPRESLDATCVHDWTEKTLRMFVHKWTCSKCGHTKIVDSSD